MKKIFLIIFITVGIFVGVIVFNANNNINAQEKIVKNEIKKEEKLEKEKDTEEIKKIKVDIKGEVANPGVYELNENSRVIDVINLAGGTTDKADTDMINLSKIINDEDVIIVYKLVTRATNIETYKEKIDNCINDYNNACITSEIVSDKNNTTIEKKEPEIIENKIININTADINELTKLTGIGKSKAEKIINYRNEFGNFKTIEDIKNVTGIGDSIFDKIKKNITV